MKIIICFLVFFAILRHHLVLFKNLMGRVSNSASWVMTNKRKKEKERTTKKKTPSADRRIGKCRHAGSTHLLFVGTPMFGKESIRQAHTVPHQRKQSPAQVDMQLCRQVDCQLSFYEKRCWQLVKVWHQSFSSMANGVFDLSKIKKHTVTIYNHEINKHRSAL